MSLPNERVCLGWTCEFDGVCLLYPPLIGDIIKVGFDSFRMYYGILTTTQEEIQDRYVKNNIQGDIPTPLRYLIELAQFQDGYEILQDAFKFFTHEKVVFLLDANEIVIGDLREKHFLTEDNFFDFQNCIRQLNGDEPIEKEDDEDIDPRLARMKAKRRLRDRIKAKQAQEKIKYSFSTLMMATCCLGVGVTVFNIDKLSYAAMMKFHKLSAYKDKFETDTASLIAGADSNKINLEYWVKD